VAGRVRVREIDSAKGIDVFTMPNARIIVIAHFSAEDLEKTARADSTGERWEPA
jgi:hypothetical protein